jgi:hypothetical protein
MTYKKFDFYASHFNFHFFKPEEYIDGGAEEDKRKDRGPDRVMGRKK